MADTELEGVVARARAGDVEAFAELYRRFGRRVFGLCRHMLGSPESAEDARSEVFLRVQRMIDSYDASLPFPRWLLSVTSHYCVDVLRRRRREARLFVPEETADPAAAAASPLAEVLVEERREEVQAAIAALPDRYRMPLVLRYYGELSYDDISAELGLKRNHVATLIFRAKQDLREKLASRETEARS